MVNIKFDPNLFPLIIISPLYETRKKTEVSSQKSVGTRNSDYYHQIPSFSSAKHSSNPSFLYLTHTWYAPILTILGTGRRSRF